jgi:hypothetical protein
VFHLCGMCAPGRLHSVADVTRKPEYRNGDQARPGRARNVSTWHAAPTSTNPSVTTKGKDKTDETRAHYTWC